MQNASEPFLDTASPKVGEKKSLKKETRVSGGFLTLASSHVSCFLAIFCSLIVSGTNANKASWNINSPEPS